MLQGDRRLRRAQGRWRRLDCRHDSSNEGMEGAVFPGKAVSSSSFHGDRGKESPPSARSFSYGEKDYYLGGSPVWQLFRVAYRMGKKPVITGGLALLFGFCWAALRRVERPVSRELMQFHRQDQMKKLRAILKSLFRFKKVDNFSLVTERREIGGQGSGLSQSEIRSQRSVVGGSRSSRLEAPFPYASSALCDPPSVSAIGPLPSVLVSSFSPPTSGCLFSPSAFSAGVCGRHKMEDGSSQRSEVRA